VHENNQLKIILMLFHTFISSILKQWELGEKHPRGTSLKLLNLVAEKGLTSLI
jgi:putative transcriptional regulator